MLVVNTATVPAELRLRKETGNGHFSISTTNNWPQVLLATVLKLPLEEGFLQTRLHILSRGSWKALLIFHHCYFLAYPVFMLSGSTHTYSLSAKLQSQEIFRCLNLRILTQVLMVRLIMSTPKFMSLKSFSWHGWSNCRIKLQTCDLPKLWDPSLTSVSRADFKSIRVDLVTPGSIKNKTTQA